MNIQVGADGLELRLPAQAAGADARALMQVPKARIVARAEGVARVFSFRYCCDFESWRAFGGQVFQRVDREIDAAGGEGSFDLLGENSFAKAAFRADHGQGDVGDLVAGGVDDFDFNFVSAG